MEVSRSEARGCLVPSAKLATLCRQRANRLERDVLGAQFFDQIGGLLERHVAIVIAMDEQHGGPPVREVHATGGSPSLPGAVRSAECMSGCRGCDVACAEKKHERITAKAMQVVAVFISMLRGIVLTGGRGFFQTRRR